jgi:succinate dehydrogenase hydrophobic anchor subunit
MPGTRRKVSARVEQEYQLFSWIYSFLTGISQVGYLFVHLVAALRTDQASWARFAMIHHLQPN